MTETVKRHEHFFVSWTHPPREDVKDELDRYDVIELEDGSCFIVDVKNGTREPVRSFDWGRVCAAGLARSRLPVEPTNLGDLVLRLTGIYTRPVDDGAGLLDGSDTYTRIFDAKPIQLQAAAAIAHSIEVESALRELVSFLEPLERAGTLEVPGLATLNRYRKVLENDNE